MATDGSDFAVSVFLADCFQCLLEQRGERDSPLLACLGILSSQTNETCFQVYLYASDRLPLIACGLHTAPGISLTTW